MKLVPNSLIDQFTDAFLDVWMFCHVSRSCQTENGRAVRDRTSEREPERCQGKLKKARKIRMLRTCKGVSTSAYAVSNIQSRVECSGPQITFIRHYIVYSMARNDLRGSRRESCVRVHHRKRRTDQETSRVSLDRSMTSI